jgi:Uncharacterized conserved protein
VALTEDITRHPDIPIAPYSCMIDVLKQKRGSIFSLNFLNTFVIILIELYQKITAEREHVCCFYPSCSEFSKIAFEKYNFIYAVARTLQRLKECGDPFSDWPDRNLP